MDGLLSLLEELVINKIRIEKMQNEVIEPQYKRVLSNEIQIVSKVQEAIKDIQTTTIEPTYEKLKSYLNNNIHHIDFTGENSKLDSSSEGQLYEILRILINYILNHKSYDREKNITVSASNDSTNLIITLSIYEGIINQEKLAQKIGKNFILFTYLLEEEVDDWIEEAGLSDSINSFKEIYKAAGLLNASVEIKSQIESKHVIIITVPISSSIIKAQLIQMDNQIYAIPMDYIEKVMSLKSIEKRISCNKEFIKYMDSIIPVISIYDELGLKHSNEVSGYVILRYEEKKTALPVHSLLEQTDIVVRPKPQVINEVKEFKGVTILGDGNVTVVFDIQYLVENASWEGFYGNFTF